MRLEQFRREKDYGAALAIAGNLLHRELITPGEYRKVETALIKKYCPVIGSLKSSAAGNFPRNGQAL
ncbi:MAG: hypothetical protein FWG61_08740 [Firmicutes bacterium]|nr:hypothetical protein [Bacillota bacterium]